MMSRPVPRLVESYESFLLFMIKYLCGSNSGVMKQSLLVRTVLVLMKRMGKVELSKSLDAFRVSSRRNTRTQETVVTHVLQTTVKRFC